MNHNLNSRGTCENCGNSNVSDLCLAEITTDELFAMERGDLPRRCVKLTTYQSSVLSGRDIQLLNEDEQKELFGNLEDPTLLGNRIAELIARLGVPPCGGCQTRKTWINKAHLVLRDLMGTIVPV